MRATIQENQCLILIVDDEPSMRTLLRLYLEEVGYQVAEANNGTEALSIFQQVRPDLILLDALMPDMDGFEFCDKLRSFDFSNHTPVLMITGLEDQESVDRAFQLGVVDYLIKPIQWTTLRQRVKMLIQQSQLQQKLVIANQQLQQLANVDSLTQVANRRHFEEYLSVEWQRMIREQQPISIILCDIDFFKFYNDTYGHLLGDSCLFQIAQAIKNVVQRPTDLVARYGGEEFVVILPNTNKQGATQIAQKICFAVRSLAIPHKSSSVSSCVTISSGLSTVIPQIDSSFEAIIMAADQALYGAKAKGRDCVQWTAPGNWVFTQKKTRILNCKQFNN
ncbi:PleD family two-component system response regulator [Nostoc sp. FACHB-152]|uniref:GGDEF domain-containing protein n=1 Tax=unclassified Nostoc TaxID=2593658 RepID=UPI001689E547|nr:MULTISPECIES: PleD family two-component system response regulator [unclassified Nostoc]MBD2446233.1 PleD family two-component system response regulator [Nostoc sp. FACHB-152]MBD2469503.1 PleD family two-component system response regulator [Nostoc sp. FACHB-145]